MSNRFIMQHSKRKTILLFQNSVIKIKNYFRCLWNNVSCKICELFYVLFIRRCKEGPKNKFPLPKVAEITGRRIVLKPCAAIFMAIIKQKAIEFAYIKYTPFRCCQTSRYRNNCDMQNVIRPNSAVGRKTSGLLALGLYLKLETILFADNSVKIQQPESFMLKSLMKTVSKSSFPSNC